MKAGWKTTEFWAVVAFNVGNVAAALSGALSPKWAGVAASVSVTGYAVSRGLAKKP